MVTKINRLSFLDMLGNMGLDTIVSPKTIAANRIIRYVRAMHNSDGSSVDVYKRQVEGSHVQIGMDICRKYKENPQVLHAIEAHHGDVETKTVIAALVQAADAISAARPGARRENLENYIKRVEKLEEIAKSFEGVEKCYAIQAGREIRIIVKPESIKDDDMVIAAREIAKRIENELEYPGQIKRCV